MLINLQREELTHDTMIRKAAAEYNCSLLTNMEKTMAFAVAIASEEKTGELYPLPMFNSN